MCFLRKSAIFCSLLLLYTQVSHTRPESSITSMKAHLSSGWYPQDPAMLSKLLSELDAKATQLYSAQIDPNQIRVLIAPHAGYAYSGVVAAATYKTVAHAPITRVIILAPSHYKAFTGVKLPTFDRYTIPGGQGSIDTAVVKKLVKQKLFTYDDAVFAQEHALEIQLPMLHKYLKTVSIVPLIVGDLTTEQLFMVAHALAPYMNQQTLLVISTDFTHYGTQFGYTPFVDHLDQRIKHLDATVMDAIAQQRLAPFQAIIQKTEATVCGRVPLEILLALCQQHVFGEIEDRLIAYDTSSNAQTTGSSVSYVGLVFTTQKRATQEFEHQFTSMELQALLDLSKRTLVSLYEPLQAQFLLPILATTAGAEKRGVFVTLYKKNALTSEKQLRGCIGIIEPRMPLTAGIMAMTRSTALEDTRFQPVTADELPFITTEISILSEPYKIASYREIKLGTHGIILKLANHQALFLPKVPLEFGWDLVTTLNQLSQKAGLPENAWKDQKTEFYVFTSLDTPRDI
jgi:AmmeMemoRadiSam system protein B/AmmeMemoRadiSam system protein A